MTDELEKKASRREYLSNLDSLPELDFEELEEAVDKSRKARDERRDEKKTIVWYNRRNKFANSNNKPEPVAIQDMPAGDERTQLAANIYADELKQTARIFQKKEDDARNRHYFPTDPAEQTEMILSAKAWNRYLDPMFDNKFTGDWCDMFDHFVERLREDNKDWTENPYFVREIKYKIFSDGTTASKYEFENNSILGSSIIQRIRDVIFISDCLPFMRKAWINENKTRFRIIRERKNKVFTKRKKPKEVGDIKSKIRQVEAELKNPDEYDSSLSHIHGDPVRRPPDSLTHLNNIKEEWDAIPEASRLNMMNKDDPEDHTKYVNALTDYWKTIGKDERWIQNELKKLKGDPNNPEDLGVKFKDNI